jgi:hypothetical protein
MGNAFQWLFGIPDEFLIALDEFVEVHQKSLKELKKLSKLLEERHNALDELEEVLHAEEIYGT